MTKVPRPPVDLSRDGLDLAQRQIETWPFRDSGVYPLTLALIARVRELERDKAALIETLSACTGTSVRDIA